ncbi:MAG: FAD-dependent oxidoreductase, partial [Mariniphaga sp.]
MDIKTVEFKIKGMTCDHCAQTIAKKFSGKEGIANQEISYPAGSGKFEYDPEKISKEEIAGLIDSTGHYNVTGESEAQSNEKTSFDLIIIGGGSAAFSAAIKAESLGLSTLMVNAGLDFGGTCVNVGCIPSKNLIRTGETAYHASHSNFEGIRPKGLDIDFAKVIQGKKKLVATLQQKKYIDVVSDFENL